MEGEMKKLTFDTARALYQNYLTGRGATAGYVKVSVKAAELFFAFLSGKNRDDLRDVDSSVLKEYAASLLSGCSPKTGRPYAGSTLRGRFQSVSQLFRCLYQEERILFNPAQDVAFYPKGEKRKREVFSPEEIAEFLDEIDITSGKGLRDRALFELMYSSGLRRAEASGIRIGDMDFEQRLLKVKGKGNRERIVPVSQVAVRFLKLHLKGREDQKEDYVFPGQKGPLTAGMVTERFNELMKRQERKKEGLVTHSIRHSTATHLLEAGAGIRYVQELLGHETIETTVRYTHMLYDNMKRIYKRYHPRENEYYTEVDREYEEHLFEFKKGLESLKSRQKV
jgi:integrase/recombinase XerC